MASHSLFTASSGGFRTTIPNGTVSASEPLFNSRAIPDGIHQFCISETIGGVPATGTFRLAFRDTTGTAFGGDGLIEDAYGLVYFSPTALVPGVSGVIVTLPSGGDLTITRTVGGVYAIEYAGGTFTNDVIVDIKPEFLNTITTTTSNLPIVANEIQSTDPSTVNLSLNPGGVTVVDTLQYTTLSPLPPGAEYYIFSENYDPATIPQGVGTFSSGTPVTRTLNTVVYSGGSKVTLAANVLTLGFAGTYYIEGQAPAFRVNNHQAYVRRTNNTAANIVLGSTEFAGNSLSQTFSVFRGVYTTAAATDTIEVRHLSTSSRNNDGLGITATFASDLSAANNVFTRIVIVYIG